MTYGLRPLGDVLGPLVYLGRCPCCGAQHLSRHALVGPGRECALCWRDLQAQAERAPTAGGASGDPLDEYVEGYGE